MLRKWNESHWSTCRCQQLGRSKIIAHRHLRLSWESELRKTNLNKEPNQSMIEQETIERRQTVRPCGARGFFRDLMIGLVVCVVFFAALEAGLRIAGIPRAYDKEDPYVGFSALQPLFVVTDGKASTAVPKLKYFNPVSFTAEKKPGTFRIFCFGDSTAYGHPFDGRTAFPRWLGELLAACAPGKNFEVINAGGISYASYQDRTAHQGGTEVRAGSGGHLHGTQ